MQNAANSVDESFDVIIANLIALVEHVQASVDLIDGAISREASLGEPDRNNVIVLNDVTPQHLMTSYALNTCSASLDTALKSLLEARGPARRSAYG